MSDLLQKTVADRRAQYGHPSDTFPVTTALYKIFEEHLNDHQHVHQMDEQDKGVVLHAAYMALDKLVRAAVSPHKFDHWHDIKGYAQCAIDGLRLDEPEETP